MIGTELRFAAVGVVAALMAAPVLAQERSLCMENRDSQALLIGNRDYKQTFKVPYAHNDVAAIAKFLVERLCYRTGNIKILKNATFNEMREWLGTASDASGRLWKRARTGRSNIFIYYSGHGVPDVSTKKAYLLSVDTSPNNASFGYGLDLLKSNLLALDNYIGPHRSVVLMLDTCFSGQSAGGALQDHSGAIRPNLPAADRIIRFTASGASQLAFWNDEKKLGLFTSVFLDGVAGAADLAVNGNRDGTVTGRELVTYVADEVAYRARSLIGQDQTPTVPDGEFLSWKLPKVNVPEQPTKPITSDSSIAENYKLAAAINTPEAWKLFLEQHERGKQKNNYYVLLARFALSKIASGRNNFLQSPEKSGFSKTEPRNIRFIPINFFELKKSIWVVGEYNNWILYLQQYNSHRKCFIYTKSSFYDQKGSGRRLDNLTSYISITFSGSDAGGYSVSGDAGLVLEDDASFEIKIGRKKYKFDTFLETFRLSKNENVRIFLDNIALEQFATAHINRKIGNELRITYKLVGIVNALREMKKYCEAY